MTYAEAQTNFRRTVTVDLNGESYNGKIYDTGILSNVGEMVQVNFGDGNLGPYGWFDPSLLTFGWTGRVYDGPVFDWNEKGEEVQIN